MTILFKILKERARNKERCYKNYRSIVKKIKQEGEKLLGNAKTIVFGSVVQNKWTPKSDIDILIISDQLPADWEKRRIIKTALKSKIGLFLPFQLHLVTPEEYESRYKKFIKQNFVEMK